MLKTEILLKEGNNTKAEILLRDRIVTKVKILLKEGKCYKDGNLAKRQKMLERRKSC